MNVVGVVLAAGLGTRLRPSTDRCPKPLIPVAGVEPLFFALHKFHKMGVKKVIVNSHFLPEMIDTALINWKKNFLGMEIIVSRENTELLGTGGALIKIAQEKKKWVEGCGLLVQNGDTIAQIPIHRLIANLEWSTFAISYEGDHLKKYKPLWLDSRSGEYTGVGTTPPTPLSKAAHFLGIHYLSARAVKELQKPEFSIRSVDLFSGIYRPLIERSFSFHSAPSLSTPETSSRREFWFDMTTPEFLIEAQKFLMEALDGKLGWAEILKVRYPDIAEKSPGVWVRSIFQNLEVSFHAPCIYVEGGFGKEHPTMGTRLVLGPHASVIDETKPIEFAKGAASVEVKNSILFMPRGSQRNFSSAHPLVNEVSVQ